MYRVVVSAMDPEGREIESRTLVFCDSNKAATYGVDLFAMGAAKENVEAQCEAVDEQESERGRW